MSRFRPRQGFLSSASLRFAVWIVVVISTTWTAAEDWPQILGPHRNGVAEGEKLAETWPAAGPRVVWRHDVGDGLAGVAVADEKVILFHRREDNEIVEALSARDGRPLWKAAFPTGYRGSIVEDHGPRCVPVVDRGRVFVFGAAGGLHAVALTDGKTLWSLDTAKEFAVPDSYFGAGSTPLVEGDKLLVNVGGRNGAGIVAFQVADGKVAWKSTNEGASYSSPVAVTLAGARHVIFATRLTALSLDPDNGQVRFQFPFGQRGPTVNGANPLVCGDKLVLTASYGIGAVCKRIAADKATDVWVSDEVMSSQYPTPIFLDGYLYGIDGRQDAGVARLRCVEVATGKVAWTEERFGMATLILADGKLLIQKTDGNLVLAHPSPRGYQQVAQAKVCETTARALPALSNGRYFVRDTTTLHCLDVGR